MFARDSDDVAAAAIVVALALLIVLLYEDGFWRLLWVALFGYFRLLWVALLSFWPLLLGVLRLSYWLLLRVASITMILLIVLAMKVVDWVRDRSEVARAPISTEESANHGGPQKFSYEELRMATNSFANDQKLGEGASGIVYKGHIGEARTPVAVKKIISGAHQGITDYISEVISMSQLSHENLVTLIGYCHAANILALVYEFVGGGNLYDHLFKRSSLLTWERRYNIALGLASALCYLHKKRPHCVIHRDIKSSNVMLNEAFIVKLGDFGLAKLGHHNREQRTTRVVGTPGYWDPEYHQTRKASKESDIYSFGVVLLEIVRGRRAVDLKRDPENLVVWVWEQYGPTKLLDAVDTRLGRNFDKKQAKALMIAGLWCAHPVARSRPSIETAMDVLNLKAEPPKLPRKMPAYFY